MATPCNSLDISQAGLVRFDGTSTFTGVTTTNHDVLVGSTSNGITSVGPGSAGQVLRSGGASADPAYSTATYPATSGTMGNVLTSDGTNFVSSAPATSGTVTNVSGTANQVAVANGTTTPVISLIGPYTPAIYTAHGVLIGEGTSSITATATGSSGQLLQSGGASADPAWTTATYPTTSGTSGNVITSNGTNFVSSASTSVGLLQLATITLTNAQIKALHGTPVEVIAAPGSGKGIVVVGATAKFIYGGTNAFTASAGQTINLYYNNTGAQITSPSAFISNTMIVGTFNRFSMNTGLNINATLAQSPGVLDNVNVAAYNPSATEITGNAANDNTISLTVSYYIVTF